MAQIVVLKRAHFFSIDNDIIDIHARTIGATALAVYTVLSRYANRKTGECWPSIGRLAHLLDLARNTVKAALRTLEQAGLIAIRRRRDAAGDATSHLYTLLDCSPSAVDARLTRRKAAALAPEEGRSTDDPPLSMTDLPGRSAIDPEPEVVSLTTEKNQEGAAHAAEETTKPEPKNPCPHPEEELSHFGDVVICQHCWNVIDRQAEITSEDHETAGEDQAHAVCVA